MGSSYGSHLWAPFGLPISGSPTWQQTPGCLLSHIRLRKRLKEQGLALVLTLNALLIQVSQCQRQSNYGILDMPLMHSSQLW